MRKIAALLAFLLTALPAFAQSPQLSQGQVLGNFAAGLRPAKATPLLTFPVVSGNSACFSGTTGLLQDCGLAPSLFVPRDVRWPIGGSPGAACDWNGTTGTDDTAAIQRALDNYKSVLIPKNCAVSSTLTFGNLAFATITGISGAASSTNLNTGSSVLVATNANLPVISVVSTIPGLTIKNLGITRSVLATAGGNGIQFNGYNDNPILDNVEVEKQFIGLDLTASGYGILRNSFIHDNIGDNVYCDGPRMTIIIQCQWYLFDILSSRAGRGGTGWNYNVVAPATAAIDNKMTMGTWTETKSFSGATGGANFKGNANVAVQGVRLAGGFYGESGGAELNFDTFNNAPGPHQISDLFVEINLNGACINITGNNATVNITGGSIIGCNTSGINTSATQLVVSGTQILNNTTFGIVNGGVALVTGSNLGNNTSGPISNSSVYVGRSNTPTTANTVLPVAEGGTGISALGTGIATWLGTPSSANLRAALTDETGTGAAVFAGGNIGAATATSINGNALTAGTWSLNGAAAGVFTFNNTMTLGSTPGATLSFQGTDTYVGRATSDVLTNKSMDAGQLTGTIVAGRMPALTGDCTTSAGAVATTCTKINNIFPGAPYFRAYLSASQTGLANGSTNKVAFNTVDFDTGSYYNTSTKLYTPLVAGTYQVCFNFIPNGTFTATADAILGIISKNGTFGSGGVSQLLNVQPSTTATGADIAGVSGCTLVQMNGSTDTIEIDASVTTSGGNYSIAGSANRPTQVTATRIGP